MLRELLKEETEDIVQAIVEDPTLLLYVGDLLEQLNAITELVATDERSAVVLKEQIRVVLGV